MKSIIFRKSYFHCKLTFCVDNKQIMRRCYLDIETTGWSFNQHELTVIGLAYETGRKIEVVQLVNPDITDVSLSKALADVDRIYTYNGSRFDLLFIKKILKLDLKKEFSHHDLMYDCWKRKLRGGLKKVEQKLGIQRKLKEVDGFMAVLLWQEYIFKKDKLALQTLLEYNREDVINLITLRKKLGIK